MAAIDADADADAVDDGAPVSLATRSADRFESAPAATKSARSLDCVNKEEGEEEGALVDCSPCSPDDLGLVGDPDASGGRLAPAVVVSGATVVRLGAIVSPPPPVATLTSPTSADGAAVAATVGEVGSVLAAEEEEVVVVTASCFSLLVSLGEGDSAIVEVTRGASFASDTRVLSGSWLLLSGATVGLVSEKLTP